jgi:hypothetical protein
MILHLVTLESVQVKMAFQKNSGIGLLLRRKAQGLLEMPRTSKLSLFTLSTSSLTVGFLKTCYTPGTNFSKINTALFTASSHS